jgi:hypothetical protein
MNPPRTGRKGIVVYSPRIDTHYPKAHRDLFDDPDIIHVKTYLLATGTEQKGKWFLFTPGIEKAIVENALPNMGFGYVNVEIRLRITDKRLVPTITKQNLVITRPEFNNALNYEIVSRLINRRVNREIRKIIRTTMERHRELLLKENEAKKKTKPSEEPKRRIPEIHDDMLTTNNAHKRFWEKITGKRFRERVKEGWRKISGTRRVSSRGK